MTGAKWWPTCEAVVLYRGEALLAIDGVPPEAAQVRLGEPVWNFPRALGAPLRIAALEQKIEDWSETEVWNEELEGLVVWLEEPASARLPRILESPCEWPQLAAVLAAGFLFAKDPVQIGLEADHPVAVKARDHVTDVEGWEYWAPLANALQWSGPYGDSAVVPLLWASLRRLGRTAPAGNALLLGGLVIDLWQLTKEISPRWE
jgi:hypothetical protein